MELTSSGLSVCPVDPVLGLYRVLAGRWGESLEITFLSGSSGPVITCCNGSSESVRSRTPSACGSAAETQRFGLAAWRRETFEVRASAWRLQCNRSRDAQLILYCSRHGGRESSMEKGAVVSQRSVLRCAWVCVTAAHSVPCMGFLKSAMSEIRTVAEISAV